MCVCVCVCVYIYISNMYIYMSKRKYTTILKQRKLGKRGNGRQGRNVDRKKKQGGKKHCPYHLCAYVGEYSEKTTGKKQKKYEMQRKRERTQQRKKKKSGQMEERRTE